MNNTGGTIISGCGTVSIVNTGNSDSTGSGTNNSMEMMGNNSMEMMCSYRTYVPPPPKKLITSAI